VIGVRGGEHVLVRRSGPLVGEHVLEFPRAPAWGDRLVLPRDHDHAFLCARVQRPTGLHENKVALWEVRMRARGFQDGILILACTCVCAGYHDKRRCWSCV
jgi:hypothetical protein